MQQRNKVGLLRVQDNTSQLQSKSAPYYQQYHKISKKENLENSQLEKLVTDVYEGNDTPDEKTDQEKIEMIKQIFNNLNMSDATANYSSLCL